ncbi:troponin I, slow skeletal muscle-like [Sinocyclocheilus grahami]|uniref:troponin I, slow skeletal muscle-like n=1 Tax=Sinocyclocheilus grahami TaxID=75366 RepID=UPI0007ACC0C0|nr:PREDICTED: troponin I, slow skeletal muscle-like [Sinocyclocheilus grahami]
MPEQGQERKSKISASRKLMLKSLMVAKAKEELDQEVLDKEEEKQRYLMEKVPPLQTQGMSFAELQELCQELHAKIDVVDEERYDIEAKVSLNKREKRPVEDSDWRKNVEAMSGMEGRKKMFDAAKGPTQ